MLKNIRTKKNCFTTENSEKDDEIKEKISPFALVSEDNKLFFYKFNL